MPTVQLNLYLQFQGQTRAAMDFYRRVFGGELTMQTFAEGGTIIEPLVRAPWGDHFGACVDRFGTSCMVNIGSSPTSTDGP